MATQYWLGNAPAVAMVATQTLGTYDVTTTRKITIGGVTVQAVDSGGTLTAALTALAAACTASAHPYFSTITWGSTATTITATAKTAGVPFVMTGAVSGGTGTVANSGVQTVTTANSGPNDWSVASNWSGGAVPGNGDTVIFSNNAVNVCWGLSQSAIAATLIRFEQSYTGKIGLNYLAFATSADGATVNTSYPEYRQLYLAIGCSTFRIGDAPASGSPSGSSRIMIDAGSTTTATIEVINTASNSADTNRPAVRILANKSASVVNVRSAPGGVGIAAEVPAETSTLGTINIADTTGTSKVTTGRGLTLTNWIQDGGGNVLQSDQTIAAVTVNGGTLRTEGAGAITAMTSTGGTITHNSTGTTGTLTMRGGTVTSFGSAAARTWTTINLWSKSTLTIDPAVISYTTLSAQERLTVAS